MTILEPINKMTSQNKEQYFVDIKVMNYLLQGEIQGDAQEDELTTEMMLLAKAITQRYSTPTNNRICTSSNTRNQAVIQDGMVDIKGKNIGNAENGNRIAGRHNINQEANAGNGHYARDCLKPRVCDAKYFREQMLVATKDETGMHLKEEENDFMLDNIYGDDSLEELSATVIMMAHIQPIDDKSNAELKYDAEVIGEVNAPQINLISGMLSKGIHEHKNHKKLKTVINTSADDQIDSDIIFDDPYVKNNGVMMNMIQMLTINLMLTLNL
ncbi:hypothetical protein Tco_0992425 [Tanacetum coccineum]|uniref:DNA-directed RNA polymerase n=1 Tax=Tanacetum coccineum TaxID=301880 RepID=A0ABQ5F216_9ASTR